ncbi:MAG TPA: zf-HC2 domain-containing protein [Gemmataceae bacterium]|nr:zf-HC2 domain-containing protein [Gemmataceae bacterium]
MIEVTREQLHAYLDDALTDAEMSQIEQALRQSDALRRSLQQALQERDRGEHSLGAVWRRERLTCPTRDELTSYLFQVLDEARQEYISFHLQSVGCPFCTANLADLHARQKEKETVAKERRKRIFTSSAAYLQVCRDPKA